MAEIEPTPRPGTVDEALGTVEGIFVAPVASASMQAVAEAFAEAGRGLVGDRYHRELGTYSSRPGPHRQITLIDGAVLDTLEAEHGIRLAPGASRRNLVVRGFDPASLVGRRFAIGEATFEGIRDCPPCDHLESLTQPGVARALEHRGGLRAAVTTGGAIRVGDAVRLLPADHMRDPSARQEGPLVARREERKRADGATREGVA